MIKKTTLLLTVLFLSTIASFAGEVLGGNISYTCLGGNEYEITLTYYSDCVGGTTPPVTQFINLTTLDGCAPYTLLIDFVSENEISDLCASEFDFSSCSGGVLPGTREIIYSGIITIAPPCSWTLAWNSLNYSVFSNADISFTNDAYFSTFIDPNIVCEDTPVISTMNVPYICSGDTAEISHQLTVLNPNGYDVTYNFTDIFIEDGVTLPGYDSGTPFIGMAISSSGEITFMAPESTFQENIVVGVEIAFFDGGVLVNTIIETMTFIVRDCSSEPTIFSNPATFDHNADISAVTDTLIRACVGDSLCFYISAENANTTSTVLMGIVESDSYYGAATFTSDGFNPAIGYFCIVVDETMIGTDTVFFDAINTACVNPTVDTLEVVIQVSSNLQTTFTDTTICYNTDLAIDLEGTNDVTWVITSGVDPGIQDQVSQTLVEITDNFTAEVTANDAELYCNTTEIFNVTVELSDITAIITQESCANNDGAIDITFNVGSPSPVWAPNGETTEDISSLGGGSYILTSTADLCTRIDTFYIDSIVPPSGTISNDTLMCEGDCSNINFSLIGEGPFTVELMNLTTNALEPVGSINNGDSYQVCPTTTTIYELQQVSDSNIPICVENVSSSIIVTVKPIISINIPDVDPVCDGQTIDIPITYSIPGSYNLSSNFTTDSIDHLNIIDNISLTVNAPELEFCVFGISYNTSPNCISSVNECITIQVDSLPEISFIDIDPQACFGSGIETELNIELTGTGSWTMDLNYSGSILGDSLNWILGSNTNTSIIAIPPPIPSSVTYCVTEIVDNGTTCVNTNPNECITVPFNQTPSGIFDLDIALPVCQGTDIDVNFIETAGIPLNFDLSVETLSTGDIINYENISGFETLFTASLTESESYILSNITLTGDISSCISIEPDTIFLEINDSPNTLNVLDTICSADNETYQISMELFGGDTATYNTSNSIGLTNGIFNQELFLSNPIISGNGANFVFFDDDLCELDYTQGIFTCPTITDAGTITIDSDFCSEGQVCITLTGDTVLDANDVLNYAILSSNDPETAIVLEQNSLNCWDIPTDLAFPPYEYNTTYYGVVIVGNNNGSGLVDLANPNISFSEPLPFQIHEEPVVTLQTLEAIICEGDSSSLDITFTSSDSLSYDVLLDGVFYGSQTDAPSSPTNFYVDQAGEYTLTNITTSYCSNTTADAVQITINPLPTGTITSDGAICAGDSYDFDIELTGTSDWQVTLTHDDGTVQTDVVLPIFNTPINTFTATDDGDYAITQIIDGNGCTNLDTSSVATLTVNDLPTVSVISLDTSFCSGSSIDLPLMLTGQNDWSVDYTFDGIPGTINSILGDTIALVNINSAGILVIESVIDGNTCLNDDFVLSVDVNEVETPIADAGVDISTCSGDDELLGTIENPLFDYLWFGDTDLLNNVNIAQPTLNFSNLSGIDQNYTLNLIVSNQINVECADTSQIDVIIMSAPSIDAGADFNLCFGNTTNLPGSGGVSCDWAPDPSIVGPTNICNPTIATTEETTYILTTTGANNCTSTDSVTVDVSEEFILDIDFSNNICFNLCDGLIDVTPSGGFGNYGINWTSPNTLTNLVEDSLCDGLYAFTVFDDNQVCSIDTFITITELPEYIPTDIVITDPSCFSGIDSDNGSIDIQTNTGIEYYLNDIIDDNNDGLFEGLIAGLYTITVIDTSGCIATVDSTLISNSSEMTLSTNVTDYIACYDEPVLFTANVVGGSGNITYTWYNCEPTNASCLFDTDTNNEANVIVIDESDIWAIAVDEFGCNSDTILIDISLATPLELTSIVNNNIEMCQLDSLTLIATPSGGNGVYSVLWEENGSLLGPDNNYVVYPMENTIYTATVTDGCSESVEWIVTTIVNETPEVLITADLYSGCYPVTISFTNQTDDLFLYNCVWNMGNGDIQEVCSNIEYTYSQPGVYIPSLSVTSAGGCTGVGFVEQPIFVNDYPTANFSWTPETITPLENVAQFINESVGASLYSWNISQLLQTNEESPIVEFPPGNIGEYEICLIATSFVGCIDTTCKILDIQNEIIVYVPSAFTPDLDGVNDFFKPIITGINPDEYSLTIFDRWGTIIFHTTDPDFFWNGNNRNGGHYVETEVLNYLIQVKDIESGNERKIKGVVTLIR